MRGGLSGAQEQVACPVFTGDNIDEKDMPIGMRTYQSLSHLGVQFESEPILQLHFFIAIRS